MRESIVCWKDVVCDLSTALQPWREVQCAEINTSRLVFSLENIIIIFLFNLFLTWVLCVIENFSYSQVHKDFVKPAKRGESHSYISYLIVFPAFYCATILLGFFVATMVVIT